MAVHEARNIDDRSRFGPVPAGRLTDRVHAFGRQIFRAGHGHLQVRAQAHRVRGLGHFEGGHGAFVDARQERIDAGQTVSHRRAERPVRSVRVRATVAVRRTAMAVNGSSGEPDDAQTGNQRWYRCRRSDGHAKDHGEATPSRGDRTAGRRETTAGADRRNIAHPDSHAYRNAGRTAVMTIIVVSASSHCLHESFRFPFERIRLLPRRRS